MFKYIKYSSFSLIITLAFLITACGAESATPQNADSGNIIQTSVALTVDAINAAQATSTPASDLPVFTQTPVQFSPTGTSLAPTGIPTRVFNSTASACAQAEYYSETIPDGTILKPGEQFTKTWQIKNTSNCSWGTNYKIIFWDGDVLGGAYVYNLPQAVDPGQILPISLVLTAPKVDGTYVSKWMLQTPDNVEFGVGQYSEPFYAEIVVSSSAKTNYGITNVEYEIVRDPATGCPANVNHIVYATFTSNGPTEISYYWDQSDGNESGVNVLKMESAGKVTVSREWKIHLGSNTGTRWMSIVIVDPSRREYPHAEFTYNCGG